MEDVFCEVCGEKLTAETAHKVSSDGVSHYVHTENCKELMIDSIRKAAAKERDIGRSIRIAKANVAAALEALEAQQLPGETHIGMALVKAERGLEAAEWILRDSPKD